MRGQRASPSGLYGNAGQVNYGAAKAGIAAMTMVEALELGEPTAEAALDSYFEATSAAWTSAPAVATDMRTATADAVSRGWLVQTDPPAGDGLTFASLVADDEVVARFHIRQVADKSWRVEGFDYCPTEARAAGLDLRNGA